MFGHTTQPVPLKQINTATSAHKCVRYEMLRRQVGRACQPGVRELGIVSERTASFMHCAVISSSYFDVVDTVQSVHVTFYLPLFIYQKLIGKYKVTSVVRSLLLSGFSLILGLSSLLLGK